ncbi:N-acetylmuramoyl-L-alanine amidase [Roseovarius azorensis]|uniref:N-acetylmuramoyl-L-alanine amidase n=1 Tax=Roseovarius azorensis TaxID=1287727 RepID=A0A1H7LXU2_9RHOB|nr:N-acetylmuramoyl-L-alanine amidase [Roseovarius azorensis]SEL03127.1 N-acetylmuramoyl-L-alanine amidase [Roseovarius azorensis]
MSRRFFNFLAIVVAVLSASLARAEGAGFSGLARLDAAASAITDTRQGLEVHLRLSQGVPYRVFTLDEPARLVLDFREVEWRGTGAAELIGSARAKGLRLGQIRPGWSRMVVDLAAPHVLEEAGLSVDRQTGVADLRVRLGPADAGAFAASAGTPDLPGWDLPDPRTALRAAPRAPDDGSLTVVLDPGHGGIDPGAEVGGTSEKDLMLQFAQELRETLLRAGGFDVVLTRESDEFVSLERRVALAHRAAADVFISLHADAFSDARARGASVYTLSDSASDAASAALAERHNRADILAGVDLSGKDDIVAGVLIDLARMETQPRAERLAGVLIDTLKARDLPLLTRPLRGAGFSVLKAPDIPSVLVELGYLSSPRDLANLNDPGWRMRMAEALRDALGAWRQDDAARTGLVRQ